MDVVSSFSASGTEAGSQALQRLTLFQLVIAPGLHHGDPPLECEVFTRLSVQHCLPCSMRL